MKVDGGCHCGHITYEAEIDPDNVILCHCTDCQTLSGTAFRTVVYTAEQDFSLRSGAPKVYVKTAESGNRREQVFCPECGTQIYATSVGGEPRALGLRIGTLRQRAELRPSAQYWCRSAQDWLGDLASVKRVEKQ